MGGKKASKAKAKAKVKSTKDKAKVKSTKAKVKSTKAKERSTKDKAKVKSSKAKAKSSKAKAKSSKSKAKSSKSKAKSSKSKAKSSKAKAKSSKAKAKDSKSKAKSSKSKAKSKSVESDRSTENESLSDLVSPSRSVQVRVRRPRTRDEEAEWYGEQELVLRGVPLVVIGLLTVAVLLAVVSVATRGWFTVEFAAGSIQVGLLSHCAKTASTAGATVCGGNSDVKARLFEATGKTLYRAEEGGIAAFVFALLALVVALGVLPYGCFMAVRRRDLASFTRRNRWLLRGGLYAITLSLFLSWLLYAAVVYASQSFRSDAQASASFGFFFMVCAFGFSAAASVVATRFWLSHVAACCWCCFGCARCTRSSGPAASVYTYDVASYDSELGDVDSDYSYEPSES